MAWIDVTEPWRVEVIRSWSWPISVSSVGWYPTCEGIRPSSAETSEPACTKRKMLSMKSSTSCPPSSRKYSAIVRPESPTRMRAPGGSFIWPKTSTVLSITPDSVISSQRSLPSRERSPTPQKADRPSCSSAIERMSSWIRTVLPTPAPPNSPTLPPLVDRFSEEVEEATESAPADGHRDRAARVPHPRATREAVGGVHGHGAHAVVADLLLDLEHEPALAVAVTRVQLDLERVVDLGQVTGEHHLDDHALDLLDGAEVRVALLGADLLLLGLRSCFHSFSLAASTRLGRVRADCYVRASAPAT